MKKPFLSSSKQKKLLIITGSALLVLLLDQLSKRLVLSFLATQTHPYYEINAWLNLVYLFNYGITFGMFSNANSGPFLFAGLALAVALILTVLVMRSLIPRRVVYYYSAIIGGALGNVADRLIWGGVFDFLDFHWANYHYPAFNVADMFIVGGVIMIFLYEIRKKA